MTAVTDGVCAAGAFTVALARGMVDAKSARMALRTFRADDGSQWTVWSIRAGVAGVVARSPAEWLAFQNEDCTERRRLFDVPAGWSELADERLDLLRRVAEPVTLLVPPV